MRLYSNKIISISLPKSVIFVFRNHSLVKTVFSSLNDREAIKALLLIVPLQEFMLLYKPVTTLAIHYFTFPYPITMLKLAPSVLPVASNNRKVPSYHLFMVCVVGCPYTTD